MKLTESEKAICKKFRKRDEKGFVHCCDCPLEVDSRYALCKANLTKKEWKEYHRESEK